MGPYSSAIHKAFPSQLLIDWTVHENLEAKFSVSFL
jgi:hypothetical protein